MFTAWLEINCLINSGNVKNLRRILVLSAVILLSISLHAQAQVGVSGAFKSRYIRTANKGSLADFSGAVSYGYLKYQKKANEWLSIGGQVNGLLHYGLDNITKRDAQTGAGPIFEANLWNPRYLDGRFAGVLSQLYADLNFGDHTFTIGRFLRQTPIINPEPWPFPNAMQGIWYQYNEKRFKFQLGVIDQISPRFTGRFDNIGETIGLAATGINESGLPSTYTGNVDSDYLLVSNFNIQLNEQFSIDAWNYYVDNVFNTFLIEPSLKFDGELTLKGMFIYQSRVGNGGNDNAALSYVSEGTNAVYFGLRAEKKFGNSALQFNVSVIGHDGRLQLPREWGLEPFYTFQRRTRVEGQRSVTSLMAKWTSNWEKEKSNTTFFTSVGWHKTPAPEDVVKNKLGLPPHLHWDASVKYAGKRGGVNRFSAELYLAIRSLTGSELTNESFRINRADFFHSDLILAYTF